MITHCKRCIGDISQKHSCAEGVLRQTQEENVELKRKLSRALEIFKQCELENSLLSDQSVEDIARIIIELERS